MSWYIYEVLDAGIRTVWMTVSAAGEAISPTSS